MRYTFEVTVSPVTVVVLLSESPIGMIINEYFYFLKMCEIWMWCIVLKKKMLSSDVLFLKLLICSFCYRSIPINHPLRKQPWNVKRTWFGLFCSVQSRSRFIANQLKWYDVLLVTSCNSISWAILSDSVYLTH